MSEADVRLRHAEHPRHLRLHAQRRHAALAHAVDGKGSLGQKRQLDPFLDDEILGLYSNALVGSSWLVGSLVS